MSQLNQLPSDDSQHLQSNVPPSEKDNAQIHQGLSSQTSNSSPASDLQPAANSRLSRFQQARDDLISDLNARRTFRPATNATQNSRPFPITVAAVATTVNGVLYLFVSLFCLLLTNASFALSLIPSLTDASFLVTEDILVGAVFYYTFLGIAQLYIARGLWQCKYGAYWAIMGLQSFSILVPSIVLIWSHSPGFFFTSVYIPVLIAAFATYGFHGRQSYSPGQQLYRLSALFRKAGWQRMSLIVGVIIILAATLTATVFVMKPEFPSLIPNDWIATINTPETLIQDFCQKLELKNYPLAYTDYSTHLRGQVSLTDFQNSWSGDQISICNPPTTSTPSGSSITASWSPYEGYRGQVRYSVTFVIEGNEWKIERLTKSQETYSDPSEKRPVPNFPRALRTDKSL